MRGTGAARRRSGDCRDQGAGDSPAAARRVTRLLRCQAVGCQGEAKNVLKTKSVWSPIEESDGLRILATRFRGRGMSTDRYDVWMANLGPSERLLRGFLGDRITWAEFSRRYRIELFDSGNADAGNATIKNHGQKFTLRLIKQLARAGDVTLMCHCDEDATRCHRFLLQKVIASSAV
ncbi:MAG: DUF488 family protein [Deltaproteobacteria bacterium]|nr:DUF488 family protein [Deltaproteobacteria bacterium]